ncbi:MAG: DNA polymerase III subunit delta [Bacteroidota bacterium]
MKDLSWEDIRKEILKKIYHPVYFLMGEEPFYIDVISKVVEDNILDETEKEFNQTVLYGRDTDIPTIISTAKRFPMMANHQVVIVKEAQNIKDIEDLEPYMKNPLKSTILVICYKYKTLDKRKTFYKAAKAAGIVFESKKEYQDKMPDWIARYVKSHGYRIGDKATQLLADQLGNDLGKVVNEIKKVFITLSKGGEITPGLIEQNIGISKDFNVFELQNALTEKNAFKAFQIAKYFADNPKANPMPVTLAVLHTYFVKIFRYHNLKDKSTSNVASELGINPFFVGGVQAAAAKYPLRKIFQVFSDLRQYDVKSKGVDNQSTDHGELLRELIYKILN